VHLGNHIRAVDERKLRERRTVRTTAGTATGDRRAKRGQYGERDQRATPNT
jgi:hypothetical protein